MSRGLDRTDWGDIKLSYYALAVAILNPCRVEIAFERVQSDCPSQIKKGITQKDRADACKLRTMGMSCKELGEIYGVNANTVYKWTERMSKKK